MSIVGLALIMCLSSCAEKESSVDTEYDETCEAQNKYNSSISGSDSFQEVGDSYIGSTLGGRKLLYYDAESGVSGVLCSDPSCTHDTNSCSARINPGSVFYYDGQIYFIAHDSEKNSGDFFLWREDLSGNNKKKVKEISTTDIWFEYQPQQFFLHHGKLYILGKANTIEGARPEYRISLLSTPIDDSSEYQILVDKRVDTYVQTSARFVGDHVYYMIFEWTDDGPLSITVMRFSTSDGKEETVYKNTEISELVTDFWVTDSEEIYLAGEDKDDHACIWRIKGKKMEVTTIWEDQEDLVLRISDGIAVTSYYVDDVRYISVKDFENRTLYDGPMFASKPMGVDKDLGSRGYGFSVVGGDREKIIVNMEGFEKDIKSYTVLLDLNNDLEPTLLWSDKQRRE